MSREQKHSTSFETVPSGIEKKRGAYTEWTIAEVEALEEAEDQCREEGKNKWVKIAELVPERSAKECR